MRTSNKIIYSCSFVFGLSLPYIPYLNNHIVISIIIGSLIFTIIKNAVEWNDIDE